MTKDSDKMAYTNCADPDMLLKGHLRQNGVLSFVMKQL